MNKVFLIGNLTRDPERTETPSGIVCCRFTVAVKRSYPNQDGDYETDFLNCTAWRGQAESIAKYIKKGNKISVVGNIQLRNYEDNDGIKRTAIDIIVSEAEFLTPRANGAADEEPREPRTTTTAKKPTLKQLSIDDDLPF